MVSQNSQEADAHCVTGLMHSGYCSAPRTIFPPATGLPDAVGVAPPPVLGLLLHAAATIAATATAANVRLNHRTFIHFPPFSQAA